MSFDFLYVFLGHFSGLDRDTDGVETHGRPTSVRRCDTYIEGMLGDVCSLGQ